MQVVKQRPKLIYAVTANAGFSSHALSNSHSKPCYMVPSPTNMQDLGRPRLRPLFFASGGGWLLLQIWRTCYNLFQEVHAWSGIDKFFPVHPLSVSLLLVFTVTFDRFSHVLS